MRPLSNLSFLQQEVFAHAAFSTIKTMVMMIGEIDFGDIFGSGVTHTGIPPSFHMPYPGFTIFFFTMFVIFIPILLTNLMVGLSVDKIHKVLIRIGSNYDSWESRIDSFLPFFALSRVKESILHYKEWILNQL